MKLQLKSHQILCLLFIGALVVLVPVLKRRASGNMHDLANLIPLPAGEAQINPWTVAVDKVKQDRGEPVGRQAKIDTPSELRHYSDTRRFLATQVAEVKEHHVQTPQDLVDLAGMVDRGELVPVPLVSENYILFGVGGGADSGPFTRYLDGKSVDIYDEAGLARRYEVLDASASDLETELASMKLQLSSLKKRERSQRVKLQTEIGVLNRRLRSNREDKLLLDHYYSPKSQTRQQLFSDYDVLAKVGSKLAGAAFSMADGTARRQMKVRLLASMRPEALTVLEQVAGSYREKFDRPLAITSLVRPDEYQMQLSKINANATRIETPPHSTGLAFDVLYRYMTSAEQSFVMSELARLKDDGRIEVLRENRDHYHVFAFVDGARPNETFISAALGKVRPEKAASVSTAKTVESHHALKSTRTTKAAVHKSKPGKPQTGARHRSSRNRK